MNDFFDIKEVSLSVAEGEKYPELVNAGSFLATPHPQLPALIDGLLRRGEIGILAGESKSNKSWASIQAAYCVSNALPFLGMPTDHARVLVVNTELQEPTLHHRMEKVSQALQSKLGGPVGAGDIELWNLRNTRIGPKLPNELARRCEGGKIGFVILDPLYPLLGDRDENSNGDMANLLGDVRAYCEGVGSAVLITHHYAKGNSAAKNAIDRASGAGAIARFADSMLTISRHTKDDHFVLETSLRSFKSLEATVLWWDYPLLHVVHGEDPGALRGGRPRKLQWLGIAPYFEDGMSKSELARAVSNAKVAGGSTVRKHIGEAIEEGILEDREGKLFLVPGEGTRVSVADGRGMVVERCKR